MTDGHLASETLPSADSSADDGVDNNLESTYICSGLAHNYEAFVPPAIPLWNWKETGQVLQHSLTTHYTLQQAQQVPPPTLLPTPPILFAHEPSGLWSSLQLQRPLLDSLPQYRAARYKATATASTAMPNRQQIRILGTSPSTAAQTRAFMYTLHKRCDDM